MTDHWKLPRPGTAVIQIDIERAELGRNYPNRVSLLGDARETLKAILGVEPPAGTDRSEWLEMTAAFVSQWDARTHASRRSSSVPIKPERLCLELEKALPDQAVVVCDTGHAAIWAASMIHLRPPQRFFRCAGSLGWALPACIGASFAAPNRPVIVFTGDAGAYYHLAELEAAATYDLNLIVVVNNNCSLSPDMEIFGRAWPEGATESSDRMWRFKDISFEQVASALGCRGTTVTDPAFLAECFNKAIQTGGPWVIDVRTDMMAIPDPPFGGTSFYDAVP